MNKIYKEHIWKLAESSREIHKCVKINEKSLRRKYIGNFIATLDYKFADCNNDESTAYVIVHDGAFNSFVAEIGGLRR